MNPLYCSNFCKFITTTLLTGAIVACGGVVGGLAGIGGSGFISSGSVTGFGSVFVNGIEYNTDSATFEIEDDSGSQQDLSIGMVVQVSGSINADGITGTATSIRYGDQLEGPVDEAVTAYGDNTSKSFNVLGNTVIVDAVNTVFKGSNFSFESIASNNVVEVSGHYDQYGALRASYIELKSVIFNPASTVEIEGNISELSGTSFNIYNISIDAVSANLSDLPNGLQNGVYVEVKGLYNRANSTITAAEVEADDIGLSSDADEVNVEGFITRYASNNDFDINGITVNASAAEFTPATLELRADIQVEAEGAISNGILIATKIESRRGSAMIHARVKSLDLIARKLTVSVASTDVIITTTRSTTMEDGLQMMGVNTLNLSNLQTGDFVEIAGFETGLTSITATKIRRSEISDFSLQGFATFASGNAMMGQMTILGATFNFNNSTSFMDKAEAMMNPGKVNSLINTINSTPTLVRIVYQPAAPDMAIKIGLE